MKSRFDYTEVCGAAVGDWSSPSVRGGKLEIYPSNLLETRPVLADRRLLAVLYYPKVGR